MDVHQQTATVSIERTRRLIISTLPTFLYCGHQSCEIGYHALLLSACNIEKLGGAWGGMNEARQRMPKYFEP